MAGDGGKDKRGLMMTAIAIVLLTLMGAGVGFAVGLVLRSQPEPGKDKVETGKMPGADGATPTHEKPESAAGHGADTENVQGQEAPAEEEAVEEETPLKDMTVVPLPPILTTLAEPRGKWIRLEGALLVLPGAEKPPELLAEETGEQILAYLRTLRLADIERPSGFLGLRDDLNETVKVLSDGQVRGVLIHGLVVE